MKNYKKKNHEEQTKRLIDEERKERGSTKESQKEIDERNWREKEAQKEKLRKIEKFNEEKKRKEELKLLIENDRKLRKKSTQVNNNEGNDTSQINPKENSPKKISDECLLQIRLPSGQSIRQKFKSTDTIKMVYEFVSATIGENENNFTLIIPNPRQEFDTSKLNISLSETDLIPRGSLTVLKNMSRGVILPSNIVTENVELDNMSHEEILDLESKLGNVKSEPIETIENKVINLPTRTYDKEKEKDKETTICLICQGEYEQNEVIKTLPCHHEYHNICIDPWLRDRNQCPLCNAIVY